MKDYFLVDEQDNKIGYGIKRMEEKHENYRIFYSRE